MPALTASPRPLSPSSRLEDLNEAAHLRADLVAVYQPVNSQELFALERMALAQQAILRAARLESGMFTTCMNESLDRTGNPIIPISLDLLRDPDSDGNIETSRAQNRNFALAEGFHRTARLSNSWSLFLRWPSAITGAPWRNSSGSKPCARIYQTNPFWRSNPKKTKPIPPHPTNPIPAPNREPLQRLSHSMNIHTEPRPQGSGRR